MKKVIKLYQKIKTLVDVKKSLLQETSVETFYKLKSNWNFWKCLKNLLAFEIVNSVIKDFIIFLARVH